MSARANIKKQLKRAEKLLSDGKLLAARNAFFEACQQAPNDDWIWAKLGTIAKQLNHPKDAEFAFSKAIALNANDAAYYLELAQTQAALQNYADAERNFKTYILMRPDSAAGYRAIASFFQRLGRSGEAEKYYRQAVLHNNADPQLHIELGGLLQQLGRYQEALAAFEAARQLQPDNPLIYDCIGAVYRDQNLPDQALTQFKQALALDPRHAPTYHFNVGITHHEAGQSQLALSHLEQAAGAIHESPLREHAYARLSRAHILLAMGHFKEGWEEFESRLQHPEWLQQYGNLQLSAPRWNGTSLPDGTLLVIAEQGFGDTLQFCRYLPLLAQQCRKLIVYCKPQLNSLLQRINGIDEIINSRSALDQLHIDAHVYMMSLPHYLLPDDGRPYWHGAYLTVDPAACALWRTRIAEPGFKVGLVWTGSPSHHKNALRSLSLNSFKPLTEIPKLHLYSMQWGPGTEQLATPPESMNIIDIGTRTGDFADAGAALSQLDLVISVDTATAHLAGGLGIPTWILLHYPPDWRWQLDGETTAWYPSMRLFRQNTSRDWKPVIEKLVTELRNLVTKQ